MNIDVSGAHPSRIGRSCMNNFFRVAARPGKPGIGRENEKGAGKDGKAGKKPGIFLRKYIFC